MKNKNKKLKMINSKKILSVFILFFIVLINFSFAYASPVSEVKIIELANKERNNRNLQTLSIDPALYLAAHNKAVDMIKNNYFEHFSPRGVSPWFFMNRAGYNYDIAGENLAMDFITSEGIDKAWMNSPTHRANILKPDYENIAVVVLSGEIDNHNTTLVVQMFGKKKTETFSTRVDLTINTVLDFFTQIFK